MGMLIRNFEKENKIKEKKEEELEVREPRKAGGESGAAGGGGETRVRKNEPAEQRSRYPVLVDLFRHGRIRELQRSGKGARIR